MWPFTNDPKQQLQELEKAPTSDQPPVPQTTPEEQTKKGVLDTIQQLGQTSVATSPDSNIQCLTIIGQIEGHLQLPPQNKTTKYEHLIPQLVAIEQNPKIEGLLIVLNTVGVMWRRG